MNAWACAGSTGYAAVSAAMPTHDIPAGMIFAIIGAVGVIMHVPHVKLI
jgi:hypothetical protein